MDSATGKLGIEAIAGEVGVSPSLVSKVLNDRLGTTRVSKRTLEAIRERADVLGYRKNSSAAALATGKQNVIAVFIHRMGVAGSGLVEELVQGIAEELALHEQRMLLHFYMTSEQFKDQCDRLHKSVTDGLIVGGVTHRDLFARLKAIQQRGVPVVTVHDEELDPSFVNVGSNQFEVGRLATTHLIERGCRRIAHVWCLEPRRIGYEAALAAAGLPVDPDLQFLAPGYLYEGGEKGVNHLLERGVTFDGLFAHSDQMAAGALNALIRAGRRVPEDVKIIGVDNSPFCDFCMIPLSSVAQCERERGRCAARLMLELTHRQQVHSTFVDPQLQVRQSTA